VISLDTVKTTIKAIAPKYGVPPNIILGICLQEGARVQGQWDPSIARLEQGFYRRYTEPLTYATTSEVLLSASYGIMQMMGLSLMELGYFEWYFDQLPLGMKNLLERPRSQLAIPSAIDYYCVTVDVMIEWGIKWFKKKLELACGDIPKALQLWNGGGNPNYAKEVLAKTPPSL